MTKEQIQEIKKLLSTPHNIVIIPHRNPDGDAIGASLAMYHYLNETHNVTVVAPNDYPEFLKWMPASKKVRFFDKQNSQSKKALKKADIIFLLDFNALHRIGDDMANTVEKFEGTFIMIDHHQQPDTSIGEYIYSDTSICSTCQMVYHFLEKLEDIDKINADIASCLYTGIMTDTGSFRFPSTTSTTHRIIADLIDKGAKNAKIHNDVYDTNSYSRLQLLGKALSNLKVEPKLRTAYITMSQAELDSFNFQKGDTEGVVNYALSLDGIIFAAIFIEDVEQKIIKISFRSKGKFSVNQFARNHFEGGGHDNAAGGRSTVSLEETVTNFLSLLPNYKTELLKSDEE
ncbi:DHH family phosphoesterase [Urechidicola croceus]|uniref:DHH family phosphoesterase n=1 Tax=Urechidicola croceus TaxID=1850246 RepID=A0A1D8P5Y9_9FLAO|nr:bifunctional oligoribonuclease/PAP phosphatase NrnA [Urechidicola croceus]AOW19969.1 DHH family phosphoesterase [Urechidicola croceus]